MIKRCLTVTKSLSLMLTAFFISMMSMAQDKKVDIDINTKGENSNVLMQPWVWVVGAAIFILLLVALLKNKRD